jgi:ABC-type multidrug transport system ATPase subunit
MLSIKQLNKTYANGVKAINNVSLEIPNGMFGLLGPNGAGKSSLMRTIATLQDPDSGSIHFGQLDVLKDKEALRRQLGYLPQDFGVYPKVSAEKLLNHFAVLKGLTAKGERKEAVEGLLQQTNLWEARKRGLGTYSGGMRQRFGIAQALLGAPRLVIVDEPTAGLDPDERNRFLNLLAKIGEQVVVILSTHIVGDVTDLCPRMAVIAKGEVLLQGEPQSAIDALKNKVWRRSISADALPEYQQNFHVLDSRLVGGKPTINVYADSQPEEGFVSVEPDLEHVYFLQLRNAARGTQAAPLRAAA